MVHNVLIRNDAEVTGSTKVSAIFMGRFAC
jgi:hypothetical protein